MRYRKVREEAPRNMLLSICLPTYNQPKAVHDFLESVASQLTPEVEIVIVDDGRGNATEEIVKKYKDIGRIVYAKGEGGGGLDGIDRAVVATIEKAQGKYVWTFGDEVLEPGAIEKVTKLLKTNPDIALVWMNSRPFNGTELAKNF